MSALHCQLASLQHTYQVAHGLADWLVQANPENFLICLYGDLGAGKSEFSRHLIRLCCGDMDMEVPSPTFTLVQQYAAERATQIGWQEIWHMDLYRLEDPEEVWALGLEQGLASGICMIEWPERIADFLPQNRLDIQLEHIQDKQDARYLTLSAQDSEMLEHMQAIMQSKGLIIENADETA